MTTAPAFGSRDNDDDDGAIHDDNNAIHDDGTYDFSGATADDSASAWDDILRPEEPPPLQEPDVDLPNPSLITGKTHSPKSKAYQRKMNGALGTAFRLSASHPHTLADSAALLMYGPDLSVAVGDLAAENDRVARAVDMLSDTSDNTTAAVLLVAVPFLLQIIRNHEPVLEPAQRGLRIPFTQRRLRFKFGIKLGRLRNMTNDPKALTDHVYTNPDIKAALAKQGIRVARDR
jgi:hypothetical protein